MRPRPDVASPSDGPRHYSRNREAAGREEADCHRDKKYARASKEVAYVSKICTQAKLPALPLEIIDEIFSLLTPLELANLAETNRAFRATLTIPQAAKLWKEARKRTLNTPPGPPGPSELSWAKFLYKSDKCQKCGKHEPYDIDFTMMHSMCKVCWDAKGNAMTEHGFEKKYQEFVYDIPKLLPYSMPRGSRFYDHPEIIAFAKTYEQHSVNQQLRTSNVDMTTLQKLKDERIKDVRVIVNHWLNCNQWLTKYRSYLKDEREVRIQQHYNGIVFRFKELGYDDQDIHGIWEHEESRRDRVVTEQVWRRLRSMFQPYVEMARCMRLEKESELVINERKTLVKNAYDEYKRGLRPMQWAHLPPPEALYTIPSFRKIIYSKLDIPLTHAACNKVAQLMPNYVADFRNGLESHLLHCPVERIQDDLGLSDESEDWLARGTKDRLSLAIQPFALCETGSSDSKKYLFGIDDFVAHLAYSGVHGEKGYDTAFWVALCDMQGGQIGKHTLHFDQHACATVLSLIEALDLDPETTRPEDLDKLDKRFVCPDKTCSSDVVYTWREAVDHDNESIHREGIRDVLPAWYVLDGDEDRLVREAEEQNTIQPRAWSCNHCAVHLDNFQLCVTVVEHVRETHSIDEPEEDADFFLAYPGCRHKTQIRPVSVVLEGTVAKED